MRARVVITRSSCGGTWRCSSARCVGCVGGAAFPYVWVPEWHKSDHGLHLHFAVGAVRAAFDDRVARGDAGSSTSSGSAICRSGRVAVVRRGVAAGYLSKYVSKSFEQDASSRALGLHRYDVAQGFQPQVRRLPGCVGGQCDRAGCGIMGARAGHVLVLVAGRGVAGSAGGLGGMGLSHLSSEELAAWVEASCCGSGGPGQGHRSDGGAPGGGPAGSGQRVRGARKRGARHAPHRSLTYRHQWTATRAGSRSRAPGVPGPITAWSKTAATMACCRERFSVSHVRR